jgi:hypothetical protein
MTVAMLTYAFALLIGSSYFVVFVFALFMDLVGKVFFCLFMSFAC